MLVLLHLTQTAEESKDGSTHGGMRHTSTPEKRRSERESPLHSHFLFVVLENSEMQTRSRTNASHFTEASLLCRAITQSALMRTQTGTTHIFKWTRPERVTEQFPLFIEKGYCSATGFPLWLYPFFWRGVSEGLRINS